eukprot:7671880-Karenia_brevis.AAC.1
MELALHSILNEFACAPRPGAARRAIAMVNGAGLTFHSEGVCMCAAPGRGAHGNDNGEWSIPDDIYSEGICFCTAARRGAPGNDN